MKHIFVLIICMCFSETVIAQSDVTKQLLSKIERSQNSLLETEKRINQKSLDYQQKINRALDEVKALREQASAIQRAADEKLLSVDQLSDRVTKWREQDNYQKLLLQSYFEQHGAKLDTFLDNNGDLVITPNVFEQLRNTLIDDLAPQWQQSRVVDDSGTIKQFNLLELGPITLAYNAELQKGGLVETDVNQSLPSLVQGATNRLSYQQLSQLEQTGLAQVTFDPTLGNASKLYQNQQGIVSHIEKGGVWALPILFFGALSLIVTLIKGFQLFRLPKLNKDLMGQVNKLQQQNNLAPEHFAGAEQQLIKIAQKTPIGDQRDDQFVAFLMQYRHHVENYLGVVATAAAIAPLLGLLGTVSGMINTFMMMNTFGTGDAATVSGGISEALVTTELGLIVAIPSLILSALLSRKAKSYNAKLESNAISLSKCTV